MFNPNAIGFVDYRLLCPELAIISDNFDQIYDEYNTAKHILKWTNMHWDIGYSGDKQGVADVGWRAAVLLGSTFTDVDQTSWMRKGINSRKQSDVVVFENADMMPTLRNCLLAAGTTTRASLTSLESQKQLPWHKDWDPCPTNCAVVRILWGLDVPVEDGRSAYMEVRTNTELQREIFSNNRPMMFWSQSEHRVVNEMSQNRVVVGIDVIKPIEYIIQQLS